jgi:hypothetical protein
MVPLVEQRLGMRVPNDSQIIILPPVRRPAPDDSAKAAPPRRDPR